MKPIKNGNIEELTKKNLIHYNKAKIEIEVYR